MALAYSTAVERIVCSASRRQWGKIIDRSAGAGSGIHDWLQWFVEECERKFGFGCG